MKRLMLGLTDAERRQMQQNRSVRRCVLLFFAIVYGGNALIHWVL